MSRQEQFDDPSGTNILRVAMVAGMSAVENLFNSRMWRTTFKPHISTLGTHQIRKPLPAQDRGHMAVDPAATAAIRTAPDVYQTFRCPVLCLSKRKFCQSSRIKNRAVGGFRYGKAGVSVALPMEAPLHA